MKIVELILDEDQDASGIEAISIVESPAIEEDFIALKFDEMFKEKNSNNTEFDEFLKDMQDLMKLKENFEPKIHYES